tara:strand:+ start:119 stop:403 length:285 start_codon:yes stop_codon:yes gene_type:complete
MYVKQENPDFVLIDAPVIGLLPSVIPAADAVGYPIPSFIKASNGFDIDGVTPPFAVIVPGVTAAVVAEVVDWQHKSFVLDIFVSGVVEGVKFEV